MTTIKLLLVGAVVALIATGCAWTGANPKPPTPFESAYLYDTTTNFVPVTNAAGQVVLTPQYFEKPKASATQVIQAVGSGVNTFFPGFGGLVGMGLTAILGFTAYLRSNKQGTATAAALAQEIQTILAFVGQLPGGNSYVNTLKDFMEKHQNDADVINQVLKVLATEVSNTDAQAAANAVIQTINNLKQVSTPVPPISV